MPSHIALRGLPIENLKRKPFRTGALLAVVTILALTFFGGTMLTMNLNTGMTSMEKRLGADLMVVPQNTVQKAEALLTNGNPSTFYFTKDIADEVMQADGIAQDAAGSAKARVLGGSAVQVGLRQLDEIL